MHIKLFTLNKLFLSCFFIFLITSSIDAQNEKEMSDCTGVKTGVFIIPNDDNVPFSTKIVRTENFQKEYISNGTERSSRLKWLSDCSYLMIADAKKEGEDPNEELLRKHGGILVKYTAKKGDTIYFTAKLRNLEGSEMEGFMIKVE